MLRADKEAWLRERQDLAGQAAYALTPATVGPKRPSSPWNRAGLACWPKRWNTPAGTWNCFHNKAMRMRIGVSATRPRRSSSFSNRTAWAAFRQGFDRHQAIQTARVELDAAITAIRAIAGFEDFLVAPDWERIQRAVTPEVPLVYLVTTPAGSLALIVCRRTTIRLAPIR